MSVGSYNHPLTLYEVEALVESKKRGGAADVYLIDVREKYERDGKGYIQYSIHIPANELHSALAMSDSNFRKDFKVKKPSKNNPIVFYCDSTQRSAFAVQFLAERGYKKVTFMQGGFKEWSSKMMSNIYDEDL